uniref:Ricin B-type lectin domain-containing protein n=1 Tax=Macrostomum lignano TaxID=282301 RepID=A0A1I8ISI5_9PLAT
TYRLNWEVIQEFNLPRGYSCCSVDVNEALGEIMFACRQNGLLHYKWNKHSGLVQATKQPHRMVEIVVWCRAAATVPIWY